MLHTFDFSSPQLCNVSSRFLHQGPLPAEFCEGMEEVALQVSEHDRVMLYMWQPSPRCICASQTGTGTEQNSDTATSKQSLSEFIDPVFD